MTLFYSREGGIPEWELPETLVVVESSSSASFTVGAAFDIGNFSQIHISIKSFFPLLFLLLSSLNGY